MSNESDEPTDGTIEVTVWVLLDEHGNAVSDCNPDHLGDEYRCDIGDLDPRTATQLYRMTVRVPRPRAVPIAVAVPAGRPAIGEPVAAIAGGIT